MGIDAHNKCALCTGLAYTSPLADSRSERGKPVNVCLKRASQPRIVNESIWAGRNFISAEPIVFPTP